MESMKKTIVVITGTARSGKDTVAGIAGEMTGQSMTLSIVHDTLVAQEATRLGWTGNKDEEGRALLARVKDSLGNRPLEELARKVREIHGGLVFVQMRERADIDSFRAMFPEAVTLLVTGREGKRFRNHADEKAGTGQFDVVISNTTSLQALRAEVARFLLAANG